MRIPNSIRILTRAESPAMRVRHPPGRGGELWLVDRLATAQRATDLLEQKERVLVREQRRLLVLQRSTARAWEESWHDAQAWIARAVVLRGRRVVAIGTPPSAARVELQWRNSMGAYYPAEVACRLPDDLAAAEITGTAAMAGASRAHRRALERAVQHAATQRAVREVERELRATRRRLRMLRRQLVPALVDALHRLEIELEERERDDVVHARWARARETAP